MNGLPEPESSCLNPAGEAGRLGREIQQILGRVVFKVYSRSDFDLEGKKGGTA